MKTKSLLIGMFFLSILVFTSCNSDSTPAPASTDNTLTLNEVTATQTMDNAIDDVSVIADDQYELTEGTTNGRVSAAAVYSSITPGCTTVSDLGSTATLRVITLTFGNGTTPCLFRGRNLKGQIILTRTIGTTFPKTMTITFNNFYINDNKLEGTSTWKREMLGASTTLHPKTTFTMTNMKLTTKDGVYTRNGERIREMTEGFSTRTSLTDDVFSTWGTFTTTSSNGNVYSSSIAATTPLINKTACGLQATPRPFPVSGVLKLSKNSHYVTIDYGTGDCDNLAMLSVDGGIAFQIILKD